MNQTDTSHIDTGTGEILTGYERNGEPLDDDLLISLYARDLDLVEEAQRQVGKLEQELMRRAAERGAITIFGKGMNFVVSTPNEYERNRLFPMLELFDPFNPSHLKAKNECYRAEGFQEVWVEAKWDMTKVKKHAKTLGKEALDIVEAATFPGKASGKLVRTEEAG